MSEPGDAARRARRRWLRVPAVAAMTVGRLPRLKARWSAWPTRPTWAALAAAGVVADASAAEPIDPALRDAFLWAFPLYEMARTRYASVEAQRNPNRLPPNTVRHQRALADHRSRAVTTPNNDTLYSSGWLDLAARAVRIGVPPVRGRYWSIALMDPYGNNFAMLGTRLDGERPVDVVVAGPGWRGEPPAGVRLLRAPCNDVWLLGRWLVDGPADLPTAHAIQDAMTIAPFGEPIAAPVPQRVAPTGSQDPAVFVAVVNEMLGRNPVAADERAMVDGWARIGLQPGRPDAFAALPAAVQQQWRDAIVPLHESLRDGLARGQRTVAGWGYPPREIGNFGRNYPLRAAVALGGLAALEPAEALYLRLDRAPDGTLLDGSRRFRLRVPASGIATDAFWSLSMYERMPDGRLFFVDNPLARYAVGDRTRGLVRSADGTIELLVQAQPPADTANWLPAPSGAFVLTLRAYLPRGELIAGTAPLPSLLAD